MFSSKKACAKGWQSLAVTVAPRLCAEFQAATLACDYAKALDYPYAAEDEALIDRLVATGHPSTPGYNDPQYTIEGRVPQIAG